MKYKGFVLCLVRGMEIQQNSEVELKRFNPLGMMKSKDDSWLQRRISVTLDQILIQIPHLTLKILIWFLRSLEASRAKNILLVHTLTYTNRTLSNLSLLLEKHQYFLPLPLLLLVHHQHFKPSFPLLHPQLTFPPLSLLFQLLHLSLQTWQTDMLSCNYLKI